MLISSLWLIVGCQNVIPSVCTENVALSKYGGIREAPVQHCISLSKKEDVRNGSTQVSVVFLNSLIVRLSDENCSLENIGQIVIGEQTSSPKDNKILEVLATIPAAAAHHIVVNRKLFYPVYPMEFHKVTRIDKFELL